MNKLLNCSNYIILDNQRLILMQVGKPSGQSNVSTKYLSNEEFESSFFNKKEAVLLLPATQLFIESFFLPLQARDKLDDLLLVKFIKKISIAEDKLYYSYYVDECLYEDKLFVICFAVKKEVLDKAYKLINEKGIKLRSIIPLPLLFYIYHSQQDKAVLRDVYKNKIKKDVSSLDSEEFSRDNPAIIYLDRFSSQISFTVFYKDGIYMRTGNLGDFKREFNRTIEYLGEYLKISKFDIYSDGIKIDRKVLLDRIKNNKISFKEMFSSIIEGLSINKSDIKMLNLLPKIPKEKKKKRNQYRFIVILILIIILASNIISFTTYFQAKRDKLAFYKGELLKLEPAINQLQDLQSQIDIKEEQMTVYKDIIENRQSYLPWIYEISKQLPVGVKINYLTLKGDKMVLLDGVAPSASKVMEELQDSLVFENLEFIGGIVIDKDGEKFRIAGDLIND